MQKRRPSHTCAIEDCDKGAWTRRRLDVCGDHAHQIASAMAGPDSPLALTLEIDTLRRIIARQTAELRAWKDGQAPDRSQTPKVTDGVVYYLRVGAYLKIGWTADLEKRMRSYSPDSVLLATEPGTRSLEQRRHKQFAAHRTHGREWYALVPSILHHIEQVAAEHGRPDPVTFAAQPVGIPQPRPAERVRPRGFARHVS